ncbi:MAG TPA: hypothetical protein PLC15_06580 [Candidatus Obscuribacter sp.]|nr:hypothetical protein [Candidatus Obscuribacter sp.]HNA72188.1 hypothetical protein [Candidatus Obscuribacter sp.]HNB15027.1 hypothetical protein [Candidatus Obscuribacter sp.]HND67373.1 hypothetical protein [Candidatus Obscuribacter sp.]HNH73200.1 hypothetical protein [Candidatus Obscuribacter sp.]
MTSAEKKDASASLNIRIREELKSRLELTASATHKTVSQLVIDILTQHFHSAGFIDNRIIESPYGRSYEIKTVVSNPHPPTEPTVFFLLHAPWLGGKEVCYYTLGLSISLLRNWRIKDDQRYAAITEIGLALLTFYCNIGKELASLSWNQFHGYLNRRVLYPEDIPHEVESLDQFLNFLNHFSELPWEDTYMNQTITRDYGIWSRNGIFLGYYSGNHVFGKDGIQLGNMITDHTGKKRIYSLAGYYLGDLINNRLLRHSNAGFDGPVPPLERVQQRMAISGEAKKPIDNLPDGYLDEESELVMIPKPQTLTN